MKKILSLLLVVVLLALISGCDLLSSNEETTTKQSSTTTTQQQQSTTTTQQTTTTTEQTVNYPDLEGATIKVLSFMEDNEEWEYMEELFETRYNAVVETTHTTWEDQQTLLRTSVAAGDTYDVAFLFGEFYPTYIIQELLQPLDDIDTFDITDPFWDDTILDTFMWEGDHYGLGSIYDREMRIFFYNKDMLTDAGIEDPVQLEADGLWTWQEFEDMLEELTIRDDEGNTTQWGAILDGWRLNLTISNGGDLVTYNENGTYNFDMDNVPTNEAWEFERELIQDLKYVPNQEYSDAEKKPAFMNQEVAFYADGYYLIDELYESEITFDWDFVNFPKGPSAPEDDYYVPGEYKSWGVPNGAANPEGGVLFIRHMLDPENQMFESSITHTKYTTDVQTTRLDEYREHVRRTNWHSLVVDNIWTFYWEAFMNADNTLAAAKDQFEPAFTATIENTINPPQPGEDQPYTHIDLDFEGMTEGLPTGFNAGWSTDITYITGTDAIEGTSMKLDFTGDWGAPFQTEPTQVLLPGWKQYTISFDYKILSAFDTATDHRLIIAIEGTPTLLADLNAIGKWGVEGHTEPTVGETHTFTYTFTVEHEVTDGKLVFKGSSADMPVIVIDNFEITAEYIWD